MIVNNISIEKFRAINNMTVKLGRQLTAIAGRNATLKTTLLGMIGQPFTISSGHSMHGCTTIDGYNFRSQFKEKFKLSKEHDHFGEHIWTLNFYNKGYYKDNQIKMTSIKRPSKSNPNEIRFWNAKSRKQGSGYVQLPVYYLSLSRLFPIGETGKTKPVNISLSDEENTFFVRNYREVFSMQNVSNNATAVMEKADAKRSFVGVNDSNHDVFTNSAGESNIGRIILAILSFKRLKEKYIDYKGGILLIDELDATLYGYSQKKLIDFLLKSSKDYRIQIVFTTHSPMILKEVNNLQRKENRHLQERGINPLEIEYNYECDIVYLTPDYLEDGKRIIMGENVQSAIKLNEIIDDINMRPTTIRQSINVYLEDNRAKDILKFLLNMILKHNYENYINIIDVDLGWTNYIQLHQKRVPEFLNSIIILDPDVKHKADIRKLSYIEKQTDNIIFLPLNAEEDIFKELKNPGTYKMFENELQGVRMPYDICFKDWVDDSYDACGYKRWFKYVEDTLGSSDILYEFWFSQHEDEANIFVHEFVSAYNKIAENMELDYMMSNESVSENIEENH